LHTVILFCPEGGRSPSLPRQTHTTNTKSHGVRPKILMVDDEPLIADTVVEILNGNGFEAVGAYSAAEAIEVAESLRPDVLLSDVLMPRMTGIELAISIRSSLPGTRIFLFSGQAATAQLMSEAEASGYRFELFPKPIHPDELLAKLKQG
jgi:CheY-like chemotaxis protein